MSEGVKSGSPNAELGKEWLEFSLDDKSSVPGTVSAGLEQIVQTISSLSSLSAGCKAP
jgi:hypothetical protein